ncbi:MAG TPA: G1 family glutamic endopeptidase [Ktedonobacterales bacterium]
MFAARQAAPPPQFTDPVSGKVDPNIVSEVRDKFGVHVTYKSGAIFTNGSQANVLPKPAKTGFASPDWIAFVNNGHKPVVTLPSQMVQSTTGVTTEVSPNEWIGACDSPPVGFDLATASDADLAKYGLPPLDGGQTRTQYAQKYSWAKTRVCNIQATNGPSNRPLGLDITQQAASVQINQHAQKMASNLTPAIAGKAQSAQIPLGSWHGPNRVHQSIYTGNVADQDSCVSDYGNNGLGCIEGTPYNYTEADMDFVWPGTQSCPTQNSGVSFWVGLGGTESWSELIQAGAQDDCNYTGAPVYNTMFIEYTRGDCSIPTNCEGPESVGFGPTAPGDKLYDKVWDNNNYMWGDVTHHLYNSATNHGPTASQSTAEFIVEKQGDGLMNFGSVTFDGIGITESRLGYISMITAEHDYFVGYTYHEYTTIGSLLSSSDPPGDKNTISYLYAN